MGSIRVGAVVRPSNMWWSDNAVGGVEQLPKDIKGVVIESPEDGEQYLGFQFVAFPGFPRVGLAHSELEVHEEDQPELTHVVLKPASDVSFGDTVAVLDEWGHTSRTLKVRTIERSLDGKRLTFYAQGMGSGWVSTPKGLTVEVTDDVHVTHTERMNPWVS